MRALQSASAPTSFGERSCNHGGLPPPPPLPRRHAYVTLVDPSLPYQPSTASNSQLERFFFSGTLPFVRRFTPREIEAATKGFTAVLEAAGHRGGGGGGGAAYRARFAGGLVATVRRAAGSRGDHRQRGSAGDGKAAFYLELQLLARLNHRHVVRLRGFAEGHRARFRSCLASSSSPRARL